MIYLIAAWKIITVHWRKFLIVLGIVAILGLGLYARSCYVDYKQRQVQEELNIERQKVIDAYVTEAVEDVKGKRQDAANADVVANEAIKKLEEAKREDSNKSNTNAAVVRQKFCELYPEDSLCK